MTSHSVESASSAATTSGSALSQAMYYGVGIVLMKGVSLLMMPYITRHLSPQQYGLLETLVVLADIGTIMIGFGLVEALYRFVGQRSGPARARLIASCLVLVTLITVLALLTLLLFDELLLGILPEGISRQALWLIAVPTLAEGFIAIPLTLMRMQALAKQFCYYNVIKVVVQALLVVVLLEAGLGMMAVLWAGAASSVLLVLLLVRYVISQANAGTGLTLCCSDVICLGRYGGPIVLSRLGLFAVTGLDRWLLAERVGVEQLAVYAIACKFALILGLLLQPFTLWWFPHRFQLLQQPDGVRQCAGYALLGTNIGMYLAVVMVMTLPPFLLLILPPDYHLAASIVAWLALVNAVKNAGDLMNLGCFSGQSSQAQMWIQWGCALLAIGGYVALVPQWGIWGAVVVLLLVYSLRLLLFYYISQRQLYLPYPHRLWICNLLAGVAFVAGYNQLAFGLSPFEQLLLGVGLAVVLLWLLFWLRVLPSQALKRSLKMSV